MTLHNAVLGSGARARLGAAVLGVVCRRAHVVLGVSADLVAQAHRLGADVADRALVPAPALPRGDAARGREVLGPGRSSSRWPGSRRRRGSAPCSTPPARAGVPVAVAGDGPLRAQLEDRIRAEDLPVRLLGRRDDVADLLAAADVALSTSVWEGQPVFVQEALRAGVPLVATDAGGTREVTGDAAVLVPVGDAAGLAAAVRRLVQDRTEHAVRAQRSRSGRRNCRRRTTRSRRSAGCTAPHAAEGTGAGPRIPDRRRVRYDRTPWRTAAPPSPRPSTSSSPGGWPAPSGRV